MNLIDRMWQHLQVLERNPKDPPLPRVTDLWGDLQKAVSQLAVQKEQIAQLRGAAFYMAGVIDELRTRIEELEQRNG